MLISESRAYLKHQVGCKIDHTLAFVPFTLIEDFFTPKKTLTTWTLGPHLECPCAIRNETAEEFIAYSATGRELRWRKGALTLHPGEYREIAILRQTALCASHLRLVVHFTGQDFAEKSTDITITINGSLIWRSASPDRFDGEITLDSGDNIDIGVGVLPGSNYSECTTFVEFSAFARNPATAGWMKVDDGFCSLRSDDLDGQPTPYKKDQSARVTTDLWRRKTMEFFASFWADDAHARACFGRGREELFSRLTSNLKKGAALKRYAILLTPRTGSTLLTEVISQTQILGFPLEYFVERFLLCIMSAGGERCEAPLDFLASKLASDNGVFGFEIDGERFFRSADYFPEKLSSWKIVYLTRSDLLLQAISCYRATQFGIWRANSPEVATHYSRDAIIAHLRDLIKKMDAFEDHFERESITPLRIKYEEIISNARSVVSAIADHVGIQIDGFDFGTTCLSEKPLRSEESKEWKLRLLTSGGEYAGFNIYSDGAEKIALLAGLDFVETDLSRLKEPLIFRGRSIADVHRSIHRYQMALQGAPPR